MIVTRINQMGLKYLISDISSTSTQVSCGKKRIVVNLPLDKFLQSYYLWQMAGKFIQDAFPMLSSIEREFLMTGITSDEWNELFSEKED